MNITSTAVKKARQSAGINKADAASITNSSLTTWNSWENGSRNMPESTFKYFITQVTGRPYLFPSEKDPISTKMELVLIFNYPSEKIEVIDVISPETFISLVNISPSEAEVKSFEIDSNGDRQQHSTIFSISNVYNEKSHKQIQNWQRKDQTIYSSPRKENDMINIQNIQFIAATYCAAEFVIEDYKYNRANTQHSIDASTRAKELTDYLSEELINLGYEIIPFCPESFGEKSMKISNVVGDRGVVFLRVPAGGIAFLYKNDPSSDNTFEFFTDHVRIMADRIRDTESYRHLISDLKIAFTNLK